MECKGECSEPEPGIDHPHRGQLVAVNQSLTDLETQLAGLIALDVSKRRKLLRIGDKSETFCRQTINVLKQNPQVVPPSVSVADATADLLALDQLRPVMQRLTRLAERASDTEIALGSDAMTVALTGLRAAEDRRQESGAGRAAQGPGIAIREVGAAGGDRRDGLIGQGESPVVVRRGDVGRRKLQRCGFLFERWGAKRER